MGGSDGEEPDLETMQALDRQDMQLRHGREVEALQRMQQELRDGLQLRMAEARANTPAEGQVALERDMQAEMRRVRDTQEGEVAQLERDHQGEREQLEANQLAELGDGPMEGGRRRQ